MIAGIEKIEIVFPESIFEPESSEHIVVLNSILPDSYVSDLLSKACEVYKLETGSKYYVDEEMILVSKDRAIWKSTDQVKAIDHLFFHSIDGVP